MTPIKTLTKKENQALQEFKQQLTKKIGANLDKLMLFGSKARGDSKKASDIDILVVLKDYTSDDVDFIYDQVTQIAITHGIYLSTKILTLKEYQRFLQLPTPFMTNIKKDALSI